MKQILENGISLWPKYDGRWPLTSGLKFKFDPKLPPGHRIIDGSMVTDKGELIEMDKHYSLATKYYMTTGKDGFSAFSDPSVIYPPNYNHDNLLIL